MKNSAVGLFLCAPLLVYGGVEVPHKPKAIVRALKLAPLRATMAYRPLSTYREEEFFVGGDNVALGYGVAPKVGASAQPLEIQGSENWVGKMQFYTVGSDGRPDQPVTGVLQKGAPYVVEVVWTLHAPSHPSPEGSLSSGSIYQESLKDTKLQQNLSDSHSSSLVSPHASTQVPTYASPPSSAPLAPVEAKPSVTSPSANNLTSPQHLGGGQMNLPDLGEPDSGESPKQAPYKPVEQAYANPQSGAPYGSPMSTSSVANPNSAGGYGAESNRFSPGATNASTQAAPSSINLGNATIGANASQLHYESKNYLAHVGLDYTSPKANFGFGVKADGAVLLGKTVAIGTNLSFNHNVKEAVLNGVWMPEDTNLKAKLSASYMVGQQDFGFYSGTSSANLSQASYYFSTQYVVPKEQSSYLHSVGASTWGSQAKQTNNPDPVYSVVQTSSAYLYMMDPRKLSVGALQGESLDAQVGITKQVIAKVSAGYETLKFPFSDGTQELNKRVFQDYLMQYQPTSEITLQAGYKMGAALNNIALSAAYSQWKLTGFKNNGVNGVTGNQGITLNYSIPLDGSGAKATSFGALTRPELIGNSAFVLRDASIRPVQLPQAFLAKVDTTAVKTEATVSKVGLPAGTTTNADGDLIILVGSGAAVLTQSTKNGVVFDGASLTKIIGTNLYIYPRKFPAAASGRDFYHFHVTDTSNDTYHVYVDTQN